MGGAGSIAGTGAQSGGAAGLITSITAAAIAKANAAAAAAVNSNGAATACELKFALCLLLQYLTLCI